MGKKIVGFILCILLSTIFVMVTMTSESEMNLGDESKIKPGIEDVDSEIKAFFDSDLKGSLEQQIQEDFNDSYAKEEKDDIKYSKLKLNPDMSFKVYSLLNEGLISAYKESNSFESIVAENYMLKTIIENADGDAVGVASFYNIDKK